jgi:hypothetical protein
VALAYKASRQEASGSIAEAQVILQHPPKIGIPLEIEDSIVRFVSELEVNYYDLFAADPSLKVKVAGRIRRRLPPHPRRPGRRGLRSVSDAIHLHGKIQREQPELSAKQVWRKLYECMGISGNKDKQEWLRRHVRWRTYTTRKRAKGRKSKS